MIIFICGFMGAGKTTFVERLKESAPDGVEFIDSDQEIDRRHNSTAKPLGEWIESQGWEHFRALESDLIKEYIESSKDHVVALGGGGLSPSNLKLILESKARLVWMKTPYEVCCHRIEGDTHRPLVGKGEIYLSDLYKEREPRYASSHLHLDPKEQVSITYQRLVELLELDG